MGESIALPTGPAPVGWPTPPTDAVYHGVAGAIARMVEPHTEADPISILAQVLVAFGNVIGRGSCRTVGATRHHTNEFAVLVGPSSKGRKGSSWDFVEQILFEIDSDWVTNRVQSGMSSGEGLIWQVRDVGEGRDAGDPGENDKRLLVLESEFALVLRQLAREGNTLSAVVRNCWDGRSLQTMTRNSPTRSTGAHVSIVGHITSDELLRYINATELANGFLNRFMLLAVRRTKLLPEGGAVTASQWEPLRRRMSDAIEYGRSVGELYLTVEARAAWVDAYPSLSAEHPGLFGAATARAEAHVVRLALIYALLDCSKEISEVHLQAAIAFWEYAARSARWIFGETLGDPVADDIWQAVKGSGEGLTRAQIRDLFSRNKSAKVINAGLATLERAGRLRRADEPANPAKGRPAEVWLPVLEAG